MKNEAYRQWRKGRIAALRAEFDRTLAAFNRAEVAVRLCELRDPAAIELLLRALEEARPNERNLYLRPLGMLRDYRAVPKLLELLKNTAPGDRHEINEALRSITGASFASPETWEEWWQAYRHLYEKSTADRPVK